MHISLFFALKFLRNTKTDKNISAVIKICFITIMFSVFAFSLIVAIMNGFEKTTYKKFQGIHSDLIIKSNSNTFGTNKYDKVELDYEKIKRVIDSEFSNLVEATAPSAYWQVIISKNSKKINLNNLVLLKAIDPVLEKKNSGISNTLLSGNLLDLTDNNILMSQELTNKLSLKIGDQINLLFPEQLEYNDIKNLSLNSQKVKIAGIFKTGINEYDEQVILCSLSFFEKTFESGITEIAVKLKQPIKYENKIINQLKKKFSLDIISWKQLYPALISALRLEKYVMLIILGLVVLIASMNIVSLLYMLINNKQREIAILKSMGMPENNISLTFVILGMGLTLIASIIGIILASIASLLLNKYPIITLPEAYYVEYLPAEMDWKLVLLILAIIFILSFIASFLPSTKTKYINIANTLKLS